MNAFPDSLAHDHAEILLRRMRQRNAKEESILQATPITGSGTRPAKPKARCASSGPGVIGNRAAVMRP